MDFAFTKNARELFTLGKDRSELPGYHSISYSSHLPKNMHKLFTIKKAILLFGDIKILHPSLLHL